MALIKQYSSGGSKGKKAVDSNSKPIDKSIKKNQDSGGVAPFQNKKDVGPQPPKKLSGKAKCGTKMSKK